MRKSIAINMPQIGDLEIEMVNQVLRSGVLTGHPGRGPMVRRFEDAFAEFVDVKHAVAVNSGTAALHMALLAADVASDDQVIVPSFTFVATAEAVALVGANPVFVDIEPHTYNVNPEKIEEAITEKTKAIIPVDLYGLSADMEAISEIAQKHGLTVIEDAAQAHGALYRGKPPGSFADIACWSFYASKNMTTGEGGMVTTNSDELAEKLRSIRVHGEKEPYRSSMLGHNYRMPEIEAALGCVQLQRLPSFIEKRRRNAGLLTEKLAGLENLQLPVEPSGLRHSWYLYTVRVPGSKATLRDRVVGELEKRGVGAAVYYRIPVHLMPYYRRFGRFHLPETEKAADQVFSLPVHPGVTPEDIDHIGKSVAQALNLLKK